MNDVPTDAPEAIDAHEEVASMTRPADVPEKFWDDEVGAVRIDALVKSYLELERKLGSGRRESEPETLPPLEVETMPEPSPAPEREAWEMTMLAASRTTHVLLSIVSWECPVWMR